MVSRLPAVVDAAPAASCVFPGDALPVPQIAHLKQISLWIQGRSVPSKRSCTFFLKSPILPPFEVPLGPPFASLPPHSNPMPAVTGSIFLDANIPPFTSRFFSNSASGRTSRGHRCSYRHFSLAAVCRTFRPPFVPASASSAGSR